MFVKSPLTGKSYFLPDGSVPRDILSCLEENERWPYSELKWRYLQGTSLLPHDTASFKNSEATVSITISYLNGRNSR